MSEYREREAGCGGRSLGFLMSIRGDPVEGAERESDVI